VNDSIPYGRADGDFLSALSFPPASANESHEWFDSMKKLQPGDEIVKIDEALGIAWILLPPDESMGGFRGISPRIVDENKFLAAKKRSKETKEESPA
jgi:hypothetical protein